VSQRWVRLISDMRRRNCIIIVLCRNSQRLSPSRHLVATCSSSHRIFCHIRCN
jgi:hypothetical protein